MSALSGVPAWAQTTEIVSVSTAGVQGDSITVTCSISSEGRFVAFPSGATTLVAGDTNADVDAFVRDRQAATTERVSVDSAGVEANSDSYAPTISGDGRFVAFYSFATNLVAGDTNAVYDAFVRDRQLGTTERVSVNTAGTQANSNCILPVISADGRYVVFYSDSTNLAAPDTNAAYDVFLRDRLLGTTERVSLAMGGAQGNAASTNPVVSSDGRFVAFTSSATNLVAGDTNAVDDIFLRDRLTATTVRVSVASDGVPANAGSDQPSISADGRLVVFWSTGTNLVASDTNGIRDIFVHDRVTGVTERVSVATGGAQANFGGEVGFISPNGRLVGFSSAAVNLVGGDTNGKQDVFLRDRQLGTTVRVSVATGGAQADQDNTTPALSADGRCIAFTSWSTNLVPGDSNGWPDIYLHDRNVSGLASLCDPGVGGVMACPCANPPSSPGRGCNNSSATGGATLSAAGLASISADSLVFTTGGEKPTALSIVTQWIGANPAGAIFGMGVRCTSGALKRLYSRSAVGGSIVAPDFGMGDPTVSARSAALGDTILPGQRRWYLVYYRDPIALGGCPATSTFNATQTLRGDWSL